MNLFTQYQGLRKENYILFLGRIVTNLGSMIYPVLTMILNQKMGMDATEVALITIAAGVVLVPAGVIGGKLADRYNKRNCIIYCDLVSICMYFLCAMIPLSNLTIVLFVIAASCQSMEHPAYNALIADITTLKDRERAYSLQYLGANIGLVASPIIAGFLFQEHLWLAFLISGLAIGLSTVLIFYKVKDITPVQESDLATPYQTSKEKESLWQVLSGSKVVLLYLVIMGLYHAAYSQYSYLMPLDIGRVHGENGAVIFGSVSSLNCIVVVIFTPILTRLFTKLAHTKKHLMGEGLLCLGYVVFLALLGQIWSYYAAIILFTLGEILTTIANGPYLAARIPASHRGRVNGLMTVIMCIMQGICTLVSGILYDQAGSFIAWGFIFLVLCLSIVGGVVLISADKKAFRRIYALE